MGKFLGKPVIDVNKPGFYAETPYYDDMRVIFLAFFFEKRIEETEVIAQMKGLFRYYYRRSSLVRVLLAVFLLVIALFTKPAWCKAMGDQISDDCSQSTDGRTFFVFIPSFFDGMQFTILTFTIMYILLGFQALKLHFSDKLVRTEVIKFVCLLSTFCASLLVNILESLTALPPTNISIVFNILFVFSYFKIVIKSLQFFGKMLSYCWEVLLLWFFQVFVFALIARIAFENVDIGSPNFFQGYSFASFTDSLNTIFGLMFLSGFPDILVDAHAKHPVTILIFIPFLVLTSILLGGAIAGNYYFHFKMCYIENMNQQYWNYPQFRKKIIPLLKEKFLKPEPAMDAMNSLAQHIRKEKEEGVNPDEYNESKQATLDKFRRAVKKIKMMKTFEVQNPQNSFRTYYLKARQSFAYKVVDFVLSFYVFLLPLISLNKSNGLSISDNVQTSELLGTLFLVDLITFAKFSSKAPFWTGLRVIELVSNVGIIIASHVIYLYPLDFRTDVLIGSDFFFKVWALASLLKLARLHRIFLNSIDYKLIIKTVAHILPIIAEFLVCYIFFATLFASVGYTIFAGTFDNEFLQYFAEQTGNSLEAVYSFNDLFGSLVGILFTNLGGEFGDVGLPALVALSKYYPSSGVKILVTIFFYSYTIITELMIINLIIGLTMDFLMAYGDNNAQLIKQNRDYTSNTNIIDRFLGLKTFENQAVSPAASEESKGQKEEDSIKLSSKPKLTIPDQELSVELSRDFESIENDRPN